MTATLYNLDALTLLDLLEPGSIDAIITDLPYGTTACSWDEIIPFAPMWAGVKRVLKLRGAFVTTASQPFTSKLVMSNLEWFKYEWVWDKPMPSGFLHSKNAPLKSHENIVVFSGGSVAHDGKNENRMTYNPQMQPGEPYKKFNNVETKHKWGGIGRPSNHDYISENDGWRYPNSVIAFSNGNYDNNHPTQKPVALYAYLIRTYTNPGDVVLDFCMGSGTTGVACVETGRNFIGSDSDTEHGYFEIAKRRIARAELQPVLFRHEERAEQAAML